MDVHVGFLGAILYDIVGAFLLLGGAGVILGVIAASLLCRTPTQRAFMVLVGILGFVAVEGFAIWLGTQSCGESCVQDPTPLIASGVINLFGYPFGAAIGLTVASKMGRVDHAATVRRQTRFAVVITAGILTCLAVGLTTGWFLGAVFLLVLLVLTARRLRDRPDAHAHEPP
ncbi:MAG: hypothetical protein AABM30_01495 [Actinomycetota bacterium]